MAGRNLGEDHGRSKLTEKDVVDIRREMMRGVSHLDIAEQYPGINPTTIYRAGTGRSWMHVSEPPAPDKWLPKHARQ